MPPYCRPCSASVRSTSSVMRHRSSIGKVDGSGNPESNDQAMRGMPPLPPPLAPPPSPRPCRRGISQYPLVPRAEIPDCSSLTSAPISMACSSLAVTRRPADAPVPARRRVIASMLCSPSGRCITLSSGMKLVSTRRSTIAPPGAVALQPVHEPARAFGPRARRAGAGRTLDDEHVALHRRGIAHDLRRGGCS